MRHFIIFDTDSLAVTSLLSTNQKALPDPGAGQKRYQTPDDPARYEVFDNNGTPRLRLRPQSDLDALEQRRLAIRAEFVARIDRALSENNGDTLLRLLGEIFLLTPGLR